MPASLRRDRHAGNEETFRRINERMESRLERYPGEGMAFICECVEAACGEFLDVPLDEYQRVRRNPLRFLVAPRHDAPDVEQVVERHTEFWVVEKFMDP